MSPAAARCAPRLRGRRRRRAFGVAAPGTYSQVRAWWSREHWRSEVYADLHSAEVRQLRAAVGTRGPVSVKACYAVAVALSACADGATGRNAMPGNAALTGHRERLDVDDDAYWAKLAAATGYSATTVQKAEQVLVARGWLARIRRGKNWLTKTERLELHAAGSAARRWRNVWACTLPARVPAPAQPRPPVDNRRGSGGGTNTGCDLPTSQRESGNLVVPAHKIFKPEQASKTAPAGRQPTGSRTYRADWRTVQLAKDLRTRIYWLRDVPHQRLMPALDRFARAGWTASDVQRALDQLLTARGWRVPDSRATATADGAARRYPLRCPWGYVAMLLRGLEPTDLITERTERQARLHYEQLLRTGPECPHGQPGGDIPSPVKGVLACPFCRHGARSARGGPTDDLG